jgi:hypothetical protein
MILTFFTDDIALRLGQSSVRAPRADEQECAERVQVQAVAAREVFLFGDLALPPNFPLLLIITYLKRRISS